MELLPSEVSATTATKKAESSAYVERLMAISKSFPVTFEVEASIHGSSMDLTRQNWQQALLDPGD